MNMPKEEGYERKKTISVDNDILCDNQEVPSSYRQMRIDMPNVSPVSNHKDPSLKFCAVVTNYSLCLSVKHEVREIRRILDVESWREQLVRSMPFDAKDDTI